MRIALIDTEEGYLSVGNLVSSGKVDLFPANTYDEAKKAVWKVFRADPSYDIVILDPISSLSETRVQELMMPGGFESFVNMTQSPRSTQATWGDMSNDLIRLERQLFAIKKATIIITCHEGTRENPYDGREMHGPDLNKRLLKDVYEQSDAIVRLSRLPQASDINGVKYPIGTRVLRMQDSPQFMAGGRDEIGGPQRPELLPEPTLSKLLAACNPAPRKILLYGPAKVGKTTLAVSSALEV